MKKAIVFLALLITAALSASALGERLSIVATTYPQYDWIMNILGDGATDCDVTLLTANGGDMHNYQPTAKDIITISTCDVFVYGGGISDGWVSDVLANARNTEMRVISMLDTVEAREEAMVEGMQAEDEHDHEHDLAVCPEYDEHVWLSVRYAGEICRKIAQTLSEADPENAVKYGENASSYIEKLNALDARYSSAVASAKRAVVLFADRFPFRYMMDDYGISYYAAFPGCSAETEASFETVAFLAGKLDELGLPAVLTIEGGNHDLAKTVVECTKDKNRPILEMNSIQSVTDLSKGYLEIMEGNLDVLTEALR